MFQNLVKIGLMAVVLGFFQEDASAIGHSRSYGSGYVPVDTVVAFTPARAMAPFNSPSSAALAGGGLQGAATPAT